MLKGNNDSNLKNRNIEDLYIPFYQIWQELVDSRTLDVYQYRVLNSLGALVELKHVIDNTISKLYTTNDNLECCKDETLYILNQDTVLLKYEKPLLNSLREHLGKKSKDVFEQKRLLFRLNYAIKKIEPEYLNLLLIELKNDIDHNNLCQIEKHTNAVISQCINFGWTTKALFDMLRHFRTSHTAEEKWTIFTKDIISKKKFKHDVLISLFFKPMNAAVQKEILEALTTMEIVVKTYEQLVNEFKHIPDINTILKGTKKYIHLVINAPDIYSAAHLGIKLISDKMNIASFYNLVDAWDLKSLVILPINQISKYHKTVTAEDLYKTYDYIDSSSRIFKSTINIFSDPNKKNIQDKLQGAFGYTNISRASLFQEEKFMNIWIALESLARTDMYNNIISNVKEILPATLCLKYIYRIVRNFVEDCIRCGVSFDFSTKTIDLTQDTKRNLVKEVIVVFNNEVLYDELKNKCKVNSLLYFRIKCIKSLVTNVSYAKNKIENHYKRVKWQIQRLYRIRNEITHSALQENTSLIIYIEHLYDYLSTFISEIITSLETKDLQSLEEVLCTINDNYNAFMNLIEIGDTDLIKEKVLTTGIIDLVN